MRALELNNDDLVSEVEAQKAAVTRQQKIGTERVAGTVHRFESLLQEHKEEAASLRLRNKELLARMETMQHSWNVVDSERADALSKVRGLERAVAAHEEKSTEFKSHLSELLLSEEKRLEQVKNLKGKVAILEHKVSRAEKSAIGYLPRSTTPLRPWIPLAAMLADQFSPPHTAAAQSCKIGSIEKVRKLRRRIERRRRRRRENKTVTSPSSTLQ